MPGWRLGAALAIAVLIGVGVILPRPRVGAAAAQGAMGDVLAAFAGDPAVADADAWRTRRAPLLRAAFQSEIYGQVPALSPARIDGRRDIEVPALRGSARVEEWSVVLGQGAKRFTMLVITPPGARGPLPVIVMQTFCGNRAALPGRPAGVNASLAPEMCNSATLDPILHFILGRYINGPPVADVLERGYALAIFYPGDVVSDEDAQAMPALEQLGGSPRAGALAAWAVLYSRAYDVLAEDTRFDGRRIAIWGHSRHGKAALLAGAFDHRFAAVIAHQSGRFGASPTASDAGERRDQILKNYAYWFTPALTDASPLSVDQHQLIALNAPIPVFLGNGRGDGWSDPAGAFAALQAAHGAYALLGSRGLAQQTRQVTDFSGDLVYFQRGGGHGVTSADWRAFMDFLDAHLTSDRSRQ